MRSIQALIGRRTPEVINRGSGGGPAARRPVFWLSRPALVYALVLLVLLSLLAFGLIGMAVASEIETYRPHIWVPRLLAIASGFLIAATVYRLLRRSLR